MKTASMTRIALVVVVFGLSEITLGLDYQIVDLGTLGGSGSRAYAINENGTIVGRSLTGSGETRAFIYESGVMSALGTLGGNTSEAYGINENGQIVGKSENGSGQIHAFLYDDANATMIDLGTLGGIESYAKAINNNGQVACSSQISSGYWRAAIYENGQMTNLGTLSGSSWNALSSGINISGQIVGYSDVTGGSPWHACMWENSTINDLGTLPGTSKSNGQGINDNVQITGYSNNQPSLPCSGFIYESGTMSPIGSLGQSPDDTRARSINNNGHIVGYSNTAGGNKHAFLYADSNMIDLGTLGGTESEALGINDSGYIVGWAETSGGQQHAVLWMPDSGPGLFVDIDAVGANNGSSWADAFNYLQDALSVAWPGAEIHVAQGTYKPDLGAGITPGDRTATFQLISGVTVKGGYAGFGELNPNARDIDVYETFLSGDLNGNDGPDFANNAENSYNVVTGNGADVTAMLDGFTITGGNADGSSSPYNRGGGMFCNSDATVSNCVFTGNSAIYGGGMTCFPTQEFTHPTLINCKFIGNSASEDGGGIRVSDSDPTLTNCTFGGNSAGRYGGGLMFNGDNVTKLVNCLINDNSAGEYGGGIYARFSYRWTMTNCTLTKNSAEKRGGGIYNKDNSDMTFINCIIWRDSPEEIFVERSDAVTVNHCCIQGGWPGEGNINVAPCFVDPENEDYHLLAGSPCIDAGDNNSLPPDSADLDGDGDTTEPISCDLDGNPRIGGNALDMGAYEFSGPFNWYVDGVNGDNTNDGVTRETAFATIQRGINAAEDGDTVLVWPGVYNEEIGFWGDAITVKSAADAAVVETDYGYAFSFFSAEGPDTVLSNFVIRNSQYGIYLVNGASPSLRNLTIVNNDFGISAFNGADPYISNCIFWDNNDGDLFRDPVPLQAKYSCIQDANGPNTPLVGLISHWKFDEGSGTTAYDSVGTNGGTIYGATWATGKIDGALDFDGDDYVEVSDDPSLRFTQYDSFSICSWAKPIGGDHIVCKMRASWQSGFFGYNIGHASSNKYRFTAEKSKVGSISVYTGEIPQGDWSHVTAVYDNKDMKIYLDGELEGTGTFTLNTGFTAPDRELVIGARWVGSLIDAHFTGTIDDVRIYDRALSDEEIEQLYLGVGFSGGPLFADAANGDYHLLSECGRYWPAHDVWVLDDVTSPCVDGGDPAVDPGDEPMPNGGRINMGAYGNTAYASMSEWPIKGDINNDGRFNFVDIAILLDDWLAELPWAQ